jgi:DNA-binding NarL/FixJ family response regulator
VLLGNLEPMTRLGMQSMLASGGVEVVGDGTEEALLAEVRRVLPDAVVLGLDQDAGRELGEQVRAAAPTTKVILWARDETAMEVFEPGSAMPRRVGSGIREALLSELTGPKAIEEKE